MANFNKSCMQVLNKCETGQGKKVSKLFLRGLENNYLNYNNHSVKHLNVTNNKHAIFTKTHHYILQKSHFYKVVDYNVLFLIKMQTTLYIYIG